MSAPDRKMRFFYKFNDDPRPRYAVLHIPRGAYFSEDEIKEVIGAGMGDRRLAQYMVMDDRIEWA